MIIIAIIMIRKGVKAVVVVVVVVVDLSLLLLLHCCCHCNKRCGNQERSEDGQGCCSISSNRHGPQWIPG